MALRVLEWRLLDTGHRPGPENMAIDEAILLAHARGEVPPTLRFYGWDPPAISIGYFQSVQREVDLDAVRARGFACVRRPTGGRLILHHMELTYSVVIKEEYLPGSVLETYRELSRGLLEGLRALGLEPELSRGEADPRRAHPGGFHTPCFDSASAYELQVRGRKIAGSAQTRRHGVILQHGSILLDADVPLLFDLMRIPPGVPRDRLVNRFCARATTLREEIGRVLSYNDARVAFVTGFERGLGIRLRPGSLTPFEREESARLVAAKYGSDEWNLRK